MKAVSPKIVLVVLNWNKPDDTIECVDSCLAIDYPNYAVLVVDNASSDDSVARIRARFPSVELIVNSANLGYAGGNNVGMKRALDLGADYVFLLNNDTTLDPTVLFHLSRAAVEHPQAGMLAPKVKYYDDRSVINSMGTSMDWLRLRPRLGECNQPDRTDHPEILERPILCGCGLLVSRTLLERVGLIDERFFIFHEEADWCLRSLRGGFRNLVVTRAVLYHKASKTMRDFSVLTHYYSSRNFLLLAEKNATERQRLLTRIGLTYLTLKHLSWLCAGSARRRDLAKAFFRGIQDYWNRKLGKCERTFR